MLEEVAEGEDGVNIDVQRKATGRGAVADSMASDRAAMTYSTHPGIQRDGGSVRRYGQVGGDDEGVVVGRGRDNISGRGRVTGRRMMVHETAVDGAANINFTSRVSSGLR